MLWGCRRWGHLPSLSRPAQEPLHAPFLMGWLTLFPVDFREAKRRLTTKSGKRPIKVGKRPIKEGKWSSKAVVLVGISVGCLMGCSRAPPQWQKMAPLKRPIKRSMTRYPVDKTSSICRFFSSDMRLCYSAFELVSELRRKACSRQARAALRSFRKAHCFTLKSLCTSYLAPPTPSPVPSHIWVLHTSTSPHNPS